MPRNDMMPSSVNRRERSQPLGLIEVLCCQPLTVGVPDLLALERALSEVSQPSVWDAVSDRALPGLLGIYALSIRRSSPLLESCAATEAQHHAPVREALSKQLSNVANPHRARQIALAILRGQSLRCYAVLLADLASWLMRQPSKRIEDSACDLMREVKSIMQLVNDVKEAESGTGPPPSELLHTLYTELLASSVLEHWARLLLTLARREGSSHGQATAAMHLQRFRTALADVACLDPHCTDHLLDSSPCLSYLLASQLVALCAVLDGGTVYGMPEAPGGVLAVATLSLCRRGHECDRSAFVWDRSLKAAVELAIDTLAVLPPLPGRRILQGAVSASVSQLTGAGDDAALAACVAPLAAPEAATASSAGRTSTAESHTRDSHTTDVGAAPPAPAGAAPAGAASAGAAPAGAAPAGAAPAGAAPAGAASAGAAPAGAASAGAAPAGAASAGAAPAGAAASLPSEAAPGEGPQSAGHTAVPPQLYAATGQATVPPTLLLNPAVRLEVSLRLVTALCRALAPTQFDAEVGIEGGHCPEAGQPHWLRQLRKHSWSLPMILGLQAAYNALADAWQVLRGTHPRPALPRPKRVVDTTATHPGGGCAAAARESVALSPLERWWGGAVALGRAVADAAAGAAAEGRVDGELAQEFVIIVDRYFGLMEVVMKSQEEGRPDPSYDEPEPPAQPSESVAAALTAGFLPCLERLLRVLLPLPLASKWAHRWGWGWDAAWSQMLAFADAGEVAAVVDAGAEGLRRAVAACSAASRCQGGSTAGTARSGSTDTHSVWRLESAAFVARRLAAYWALTWLPVLAGGLVSEAGSPDGGAAGAAACDTAAAACVDEGRDGEGASVAAAGDVGVHTVAARLGESLSLICTRLLPELSRGLLGGLLPLFRHGIVGLSSVCILVGRQLVWVPTLAAALAASSAPSAAALTHGSTGGGGCSSDASGSCNRWRQLLFVELRLPSLLGVALELSMRGGTAEESNHLDMLCEVLCAALRALAALVPAELARMVAAADRAEAAAACRTAASRRPAGAAAAPPAPSPPSSGLLRRALGLGGPLEDAELLATVEAACAGRVGPGAGMPGGGEGNGWEGLLLGARLLVLHG